MAIDYAQRERDPTRHMLGITAVVILHVLVIWALVSGLARKVVEVVKGPIEVKVIEEVVKKPPPPPEVVPPPPKVQAPPPPFIPPPEINIAPQQQAPTITAVTRDAPPSPQAPVIQKVPESQGPPQPAIRSAAVACSNYRDVMSSIVYPREALQSGTEGEVIIEFTVATNGQIKDAVIKSSSNRVFNRASMAVVNQLSCQGQAQDVRVQAPISFKIR